MSQSRGGDAGPPVRPYLLAAASSLSSRSPRATKTASSSTAASPSCSAYRARRQPPDNPQRDRLLLCTIATIFAITAFTDEFVARQLLLGSETMLVPPAWLQSWLLVPGLTWCRSLLLFPDGHPPSPRWRWVVRAIVVLGAMAVLGFIVAPGELEAPDRFLVANPIVTESMPGLSTAPSRSAGSGRRRDSSRSQGWRGSAVPSGTNDSIRWPRTSDSAASPCSSPLLHPGAHGRERLSSTCCS